MIARRLVSLIAAWSVCLPFALHAETYRLGPDDDWYSMLCSRDLKPGDEVILSAGTYSDPRRLSLSHRGTAEHPIVIRAADVARVVITRPDSEANVVNIEGAQYLVLRDLEITGGSSGIRINQSSAGIPAKFVTLDGNHIHHVGGVGVTANFPGTTYEGMHFLNNEIHDTAEEGEAFYLGCNNNECQFFDGLIERNYIHDLAGDKVVQGDGIEIKYGSYNNIIRDNVIHDTKQPGIIVYGTAGNGDPNVIERNAIWNSGDHGIQAAADAIIRNNLVFSTRGDGIHCRDHQGAIPGNLTIVNNTVRCDGRAVRIQSDHELSGPIVIANNALYPVGGQVFALTKSERYSVLANVGAGRTSEGLPATAFSSRGSLEADFVDFEERNAFPADGSSLIGMASHKHLPADDFNQTRRGDSRDVGAYKFQSGGNPAGPVKRSFKSRSTDEDSNN
jgi:parallel beta-helix repeat protein